MYISHLEPESTPGFIDILQTLQNFQNIGEMVE